MTQSVNPNGASAPETPEEFAAALRELRRRAGDPTLAALSDRTGISKSVLSEALSGSRLPTERTVAKLTAALNADPEQWIARRTALDPKLLDAKRLAKEAPKPKFSTLQTVLIGIAAAAVGIAITSMVFVFAIQGDAADAGSTDTSLYKAAANGEDPMLTKCREDSVIAASEPRLDDQVLVEMIYSTECMAVWGRVTRYDGSAADNSITMRIYPAGDEQSERAQERSVDDLQSMYTPMLIEPDVNARICGHASVTHRGETVDLGPELCI